VSKDRDSAFEMAASSVRYGAGVNARASVRTWPSEAIIA
jgi:hypothetical protein